MSPRGFRVALLGETGVMLTPGSVLNMEGYVSTIRSILALSYKFKIIVRLGGLLVLYVLLLPYFIFHLSSVILPLLTTPLLTTQ